MNRFAVSPAAGRQAREANHGRRCSLTMYARLFRVNRWLDVALRDHFVPVGVGLFGGLRDGLTRAIPAR